MDLDIEIGRVAAMHGIVCVSTQPLNYLAGLNSELTAAGTAIDLSKVVDGRAQPIPYLLVVSDLDTFL